VIYCYQFITQDREEGLLADYGLVALFLLVAIFFAVTTLLLPVILRFLKIVPQKPNPIKRATYECGMETIGKSWVQFNFRYYFYALVFVAIDVLVVFLYPWAVDLRQLGISGFIGVVVLISIVIVGYVYAWRRKVLEWK
jgi:NADH-quinone oxidoreductase subunit A